MNLKGIPCPLITFCCSHNFVDFKLWCKGKNFYDKGQGINAEPLTFVAVFFEMSFFIFTFSFLDKWLIISLLEKKLSCLLFQFQLFQLIF